MQEKNRAILPRKGTLMKDLLLILGLLAAWIVLNAWILPKFGVST